jgi:multidrug transporter EmrE-like cation transporter
MIMYPMLSGFTMISNMLLGIIFFKERLNPRQTLGILVGISAVVLIGF